MNLFRKAPPAPPGHWELEYLDGVGGLTLVTLDLYETPVVRRPADIDGRDLGLVEVVEPDRGVVVAVIRAELFVSLIEVDVDGAS